MFTAPPGLTARYKQDKPKRHWTHRRVVAFDDDRRPLVINDDHRLEPADRYRNYDGITDQHQEGNAGDYTALLPAGGWRIEYTTSEGTWSEPLVGWAIQDGSVVPLTTDSTGLVLDLDHAGDDYRIYHPDTTDPEPKTTTGSPPAAEPPTEEKA